jgi:hypothetical protein
MLAASGIAIDRTAAAKMQPLIRKRAMEMGRSLDDHDVATLFNETIGNKRTTEDKDEP